MKEYRYKNKKEFEAEFGKNWRTAVEWYEDRDRDFGKLLSPIQNAEIAYYGRCSFVDLKWVKEIPQVSCDVEKVFFDEDKKRVTVKLRNGNEGRSTCNPEDDYDPYIGFAVAYTRAILGSSNKLREYVDRRISRLAHKDSPAPAQVGKIPTGVENNVNIKSEFPGFEKNKNTKKIKCQF